MLAQLLSLGLFHYLLIFVRVGAAMTVLPGFTATHVNAKARLLMALAISLVLTPAVSPYLPAPPGNIATFVLLVLGEAIIGIFLGTVIMILTSALHVAGTLIAFISGMANAMVFDPIAQQQGGLVSAAVGTIGLVLIFVTNLHHDMLRVIFDSYTLFTPGKLPASGDMTSMVLHQVANAFQIGVRLSAPFLIVMLTLQAMMGLISRLMPAFQVFFVIMPLQQALAFILLAFSLSGMMAYFLHWFDGEIRLFIAP